MRRFPVLSVIAVAAVAAVSLTACVSSTSDDVNTHADSSSSTGGGANAAASHSGGKKKTAEAHLGQAITITGETKGEKIQVIATKYVKVAKPSDEFNTPDKGNRFAAVQFRIRNTGTAAYDDSPSNGAEIIDKQGQQYDSGFDSDSKAGPGFPATVKLAPGSSALGYIVFEVPKKTVLTQVQFSEDSGFGQTAEWTLSK